MPFDNADPVALVEKALGDFTMATKAELAAAKKQLVEANARLTELEQKTARTGNTADERGETWGARFVREKAAELRSLAQDRGRTALQLKATLTSATAGGSPSSEGAVGDLVVPRRDLLIGLPRRRATIRSLLTVTPVDATNSIEYASQQDRNLNAAPVAEGALKPESDIQFELKTAPVRTLAHWMKASRQILADAPQLTSFINDELLYGLMLLEEDEILNGDNTGQHLHGIVPQATAFSSPISMGSPDASTMIDIIGAAILQASLTEVPPDGMVLHPADFWRMRLIKDEDGKYILGDPQEVVAPSLFGLPAVLTQAMTVDKFLVGSFSSQVLYDREAARVEASTEDSDNFIRNLVTILGEERIGLAVKRPGSMIFGDFGNS